MKTRPPLDILVWCHLPSWAIWSPSLRPQFSPARLSGLKTRDNYQKVSIRISTSISNLNLQFVIKRKSTCSTSILVTGLSPDLCPSRLYIITIWRCFNWNLEMGVLHFQERSKPLNGTWIPWVPLHFTWFSLRMQKKTEGKWYFSSSPSSSYWRMGPELTRLAGVPISLGLAEDRLDANLQELVIRPRSY